MTDGYDILSVILRFRTIGLFSFPHNGSATPVRRATRHGLNPSTTVFALYETNPPLPPNVGRLQKDNHVLLVEMASGRGAPRPTTNWVADNSRIGATAFSSFYSFTFSDFRFCVFPFSLFLNFRLQLTSRLPARGTIQVAALSFVFEGELCRTRRTGPGTPRGADPTGHGHLAPARAGFTALFHT